MGARSTEKAENVITDIKRELENPQADIVFLKLDLTDFKSVAEAARELIQYVFPSITRDMVFGRDKHTNFYSKETVLHGLINNAGIMAVPFSRTKDGYEI